MLLLLGRLPPNEIVWTGGILTWTPDALRGEGCTCPAQPVAKLLCMPLFCVSPIKP